MRVAALHPSIGYGLVALAACGAVLAISATMRDGTSTARGAVILVEPTPSAVEFGVIFVETANSFAASQRDSARVSNADCVQGSAGHYMCSYVSKRRGAAKTCHVMQARWTPGAASSYAVTLAGRAARCGSLREALQSLR